MLPSALLAGVCDSRNIPSPVRIRASQLIARVAALSFVRLGAEARAAVALGKRSLRGRVLVHPGVRSRCEVGKVKTKWRNCHKDITQIELYSQQLLITSQLASVCAQASLTGEQTRLQSAPRSQTSASLSYRDRCRSAARRQRPSRPGSPEAANA